MLAIVYGIYGVISVIVVTIVNYIFLVSPTLENAAGAGPGQSAALVGAIAGTVGGCCGGIYPVILLIFMMRPGFAAAFKGNDTNKMDFPAS